VAEQQLLHEWSPSHHNNERADAVGIELFHS
jgi:hypothetical protein